MKALRFPALALAAGLAAGCHSGDETDYYELTPVTGKITLDGQPLAGAKIIFTPQGNVPDTPGSDVTDASGSYNIMYRGRAGVAKGTYSIFVCKTLGEVAEDPAESSGEFSEERALAAMRKAAEQTAASVKKGAGRTKLDIASQTYTREVNDSPIVLDFDLKKTQP